jgi:hypothetical protein
VRRRFLGEGLLLAGAGGLLGLAGAGVYTRVLLRRLEGAAGMPRLSFAVSPETLAWGWLASVATVLVFLAVAVRRLSRQPAPRLLAGAGASAATRAARGRGRLAGGVAIAAAAGTVACGVALRAAHGGAPELAFGAAAGMLVAGLSAFAVWCGRAGERRPIGGACSAWASATPPPARAAAC